MALSILCNEQGLDRVTFIPAEELATAVREKLLTEEEARHVYWSQFAPLREQARQTAVLPPPIAAAA